jgi:hypothetical protein
MGRHCRKQESPLWQPEAARHVSMSEYECGDLCTAHAPAHAGGWGDSEKRGRVASRQTQPGALEVHMSSAGANPEGSSSEGNRMDMNCGLASLRVNRGVPHSGQKLRVASLPLLARTEYALAVPMISRSLLATTTPDAKGAPLERWQSRQWQFSMAVRPLLHV